RAAAGSESVDGERLGDADLLDSYFQDVARFRIPNVDRPGEPMSAGSAVLHLVELPHRRRNQVFLDPEALQKLGSGKNHFDADRIAGRNGQDGLRRRIEVAP